MKWGRSETLRGEVLTDVAQIDRKKRSMPDMLSKNSVFLKYNCMYNCFV